MYFETSSTSPYQIRRIEELNKTASGNVEAKVMCFYRRRDLPSPLIQLADKHQSECASMFSRAKSSRGVADLPRPVRLLQGWISLGRVVGFYLGAGSVK